MKWFLPTNIFWVIGHFFILCVGVFLTIVAAQFSYRDVLLGIGGSLIASGIAGEILFLYIAFSQDAKERLDLPAKKSLP
jgi:hypothetical protein